MKAWEDRRLSCRLDLAEKIRGEKELNVFTSRSFVDRFSII